MTQRRSQLRNGHPIAAIDKELWWCGSHTRELEKGTTSLSRLVVQGEEVAIACNAGETVLDALYRSGYAYRTGCRRGGCGICKVDLISGSVEYNRVVADTVLSEQERVSGTCLTCRAVPTSDMVIALRDETLRKVGGLLAYAMSASATGN